jgi:hypothetical protein
MLMPPIPVNRYLVPEPATTTPDGFTLVDEAILRGLPHTIQLSPTARIQLLLVHGVAVPWRDADSAAVVTRSEPERGVSRPADPPPHVPLRLALSIDDRLVGAAPLGAGARFMLPEAADGVRYEFVILGWDVRAGSVKGPGPYGSRISFAWREANKAVNDFSPPPVPFKVVARLPDSSRLMSELGVIGIRNLTRFLNIKQARLR